MSKKVLLAGESWMSYTTHVKGFDAFYTSTYETGEKWLKAALEAGGYEVTFLPNHLANEEFPFTMEELKQYDLVIRVGRATFFVILLVLSGFIIFGREFLLVWVGEGYEAAYWVAIIVMLPFSVDLAQNLGLCILQVKGQYGFRAKIYLLSALLNIITTVLFARRIGITGAALSTGISMFLTSGLIMNWFFQKRVGLNMIKFWKTTIGIISLAVLLTGAACFIKGMIWHDPVSIIQLGLGILLYTIVYGAVMFLFATDPAERELLQRLLKTRRKSRL